MNTPSPALEEQIDNCQGLLKLFQKERETCLDNGNVNKSELVGLLQAKLLLLTTLEQQRHSMQRTEEVDKGPNQNPKQKQLVRKLASLVEQLLVIEQENEGLLRKRLSAGANLGTSRRTNTPAHRTASNLKRFHNNNLVGKSVLQRYSRATEINGPVSRCLGASPGCR